MLVIRRCFSVWPPSPTYHMHNLSFCCRRTNQHIYRWCVAFLSRTLAACVFDFVHEARPHDRVCLCDCIHGCFRRCFLVLADTRPVAHVLDSRLPTSDDLSCSHISSPVIVHSACVPRPSRSLRPSHHGVFDHLRPPSGLADAVFLVQPAGSVPDR